MSDRERLLQELEQASDELIVETLNFLRSRTQQRSTPSSHSTLSSDRNSEEIGASQSPEARIQHLKEWMANLPKNDTPLPEAALHRDSMYD